MIRFLTAGESHGPELTGIIEGLPAGFNVTKDYIDSILKSGGERANSIASKKVQEIKRIIGF